MTNQHHLSLVRLYLPLLANSQPEIATQAGATLLATYDEHALTDLRQMLNDSDIPIRHMARIARLTLANVDGLEIEPPETGRVYIECLGRLRIHLGTRVVQPQDWAQIDTGRVGWQKMQSVLAYLIHCGSHGTNYAALGEAVWGNTISAAHVMRTVTALRQVLIRVCGQEFVDQTLLLARDYCIFDTHNYQSDVQVFERLLLMADQIAAHECLDAAVPLYGQATCIYGGPYMADVRTGSDWNHVQRDRLAQRFIHALERQAEHAYDQTHDQQCIALCQQAIEISPTERVATALLLRAFIRQGEFGEVERAYRRYIQAMTRETQRTDSQQDSVAQVYQTMRLHPVPNPPTVRRLPSPPQATRTVA